MRIIVGFPPGGPTDIMARLMGQWLTERLGKPFIIDNRPGAAGNIAAEAVVGAPPDGYTLLLITSANASNASLYDKLSFRRKAVPHSVLDGREHGGTLAELGRAGVGQTDIQQAAMAPASVSSRVTQVCSTPTLCSFKEALKHPATARSASR